MAGLKAITDKIICDATAEAYKKTETAKKQAEKIMLDTDALCNSIRLCSQKEAADLEKKEKLKLAALLEANRRDIFLQAEYDAINEIITAAKDRILSLPTKEYFSFLADIYKNTCDDGTGELLLCQSDRARMDKSFIKKLSGSKGSLTLATESAPSPGFIVRCGKTEQNCTFDAIFRHKRDELFDIAVKFLRG